MILPSAVYCFCDSLEFHYLQRAELSGTRILPFSVTRIEVHQMLAQLVKFHFEVQCRSGSVSHSAVCSYKPVRFPGLQRQPITDSSVKSSIIHSTWPSHLLGASSLGDLNGECEKSIADKAVNMDGQK